MPSLGRSIIAAVAGYITLSVLTILYYLALSFLLPELFGIWIVYVTLGTIAGGLFITFCIGICSGAVTARLAPHRPLLHASILVGVIMIHSFASALNSGGRGSLFAVAKLVVPLVGILLGGWIVSYQRTPRRNDRRSDGKQRIIQFLVMHERITNNDVERLLGVSDATATRYLEALEQENRIEQVGVSGRSAYYRLRS